MGFSLQVIPVKTRQIPPVLFHFLLHFFRFKLSYFGDELEKCSNENAVL